MDEKGDGEGRRPPSNLRGLLNFCTELTVREDTTTDSSVAALDSERQAFLEEALSSITVNVAKRLAESVKILCHEAVMMHGEDVTEQENAIEVIEEYVDDLNHAIDLQKMGGFPVLKQCLDSPHTSLRVGAASLIGDVCQNNLSCQESMLSLNIIPPLLHMVDTDEDKQGKVKALYALSCLIRDFPKGEEEFVKANGFSSLMRALQSGIENLVIKSLFLLNSLVRNNVANKEISMSMGYIEQLVTMLGSENTTNIISEHCTATLLALVSSHPPAMAECMRPEFSFPQLLASRLQDVKGKPEMQEEEDYIRQLLKLVENYGGKEEVTNR